MSKSNSFLRAIKDFWNPIDSTKAIKPQIEKKSYLPARTWSSMSYGRGTYTPNRFNKSLLIQQVYERNAPYYSAVNIIANLLSQMDIYVEYTKNGKRHDTDDHPLLRALERGEGRQDLVERMTKYLLTTGDTYAEIVESPYDSRHLGYVCMPTQHVRNIQGDRFMPIQAYEYLEHDRVVLSENKVVHVYFPSLMHYHEGFSPAIPLAETIDLHNASIEWNKNTALGGGSPPFIGKVMNWDEEEATRIKEAWRSQRGAKNQADITIVPEELQLEKFAHSPHDAEWEQAVLQSMRMIFMTLNVSSSIMNDAGNKTYNNIHDSRKGLYSEGIIPLAKKIYKKFTQKSQRYYKDNPVIKLDEDKIDAIQEDKEHLTKRVVMAVNAGLISANEGREELGWKRKDGEEYDKLKNVSSNNQNTNDKETQVQTPTDGVPSNTEETP